MSTAPIGVFDSGLGGLSAVKQLKRLLPNENIIYFGDTGRVPYGNRSRETIKMYAQQDADFLLSMNVKAIIAACGTVSSVASDLGEKLSVPFTGVLYPTSCAAIKATKNGKIGVIGTTATIKSKSFESQIKSLNNNVRVISKDCPLFVPLVENGFSDRDNEIAKLTARHYLKEIKESGVDTIILGCTHYPILKAVIGEYVGEDVKLIDSGLETAKMCQQLLSENNLLNRSNEKGSYSYFVSDSTEDFSRLASIFLKEEISSEVSRIDISKY